MTKFNINEIAKVEYVLNQFPEVTWDRWSGVPKCFMVFGWIERKDSHSDYVQILIENGYIGQISTSSAVHSESFAKRVGLGHTDCQRVEHFFGKANCIKLKNSRTTLQLDRLEEKDRIVESHNLFLPKK